MYNPPVDLAEGETYVGLIGNHLGEAYHLILLPGDNDDATWQAQMEWAKSIGGDLPDRVEQAMLFKHFKGEFKEDWYWSNTAGNDKASWAWYQGFNHGFQGSYGTNDEFRARAVRRVPFNP